LNGVDRLNKDSATLGEVELEDVDDSDITILSTVAASVTLDEGRCLNVIVPAVGIDLFAVCILYDVCASLRILDAEGSSSLIRFQSEPLSQRRSASVVNVPDSSTTGLDESRETRKSLHGGVEPVPQVVHESVQHIT
jgi:hypothetical protein